MARTEQALIDEILLLLLNEPQGLEVIEIIERITSDRTTVSERGIRNLINRLEKEGQLLRRKRWRAGPGAPPYVYHHPKTMSNQMDLFSDELGIRYEQLSRDTIEQGEIDQDERKRQAAGRGLLEQLQGATGITSVLETMAEGHVREDQYAALLLRTAAQLADEHPVDLLIQMAQWVVDDVNTLADEAQRLMVHGDIPEAESKARELDFRLGWAKRYFQRFWRLHRSIGQSIAGVLDLPSQAKSMLRTHGDRASLDSAAARDILRRRIGGDRLISEQIIPPDLHKAAVGTDASVADLFLEHGQGSFIAPDPVVVTAASAAMKTRGSGQSFEYQDFDIFPDQLREYEDHRAAAKGLVISPLLRRILPEEDFKHSRMAAMELRQYGEDFRVIQKQARWRPIGEAPALGIMPKPTLIFRDGRLFPLVHRLKDYEDSGLYGLIVRSQIEQYANVINHTLSGLGGNITYAAAVKSPELSWLAPVVFWYIYRHQQQLQTIMDSDDVYRTPFSDAAVMHLLFLGKAKQRTSFSPNTFLVSCRAMRRFSDIGFEGEDSNPVVLREGNALRVIDDNDQTEWEQILHQRLEDKQRTYREVTLDEDDYRPFTYLCAKVGVSMCYAAPMTVYEPLVADEHGAHFLLPRLEVAIDMQQPQEEPEKLEKMLSWLAGGGYELDRAHTHSAFDTGTQEPGLPILVPDVIVLAHEAVTFARDQMGIEVQDEIRSLIAELRRRSNQSRP